MKVGRLIMLRVILLDEGNVEEERKELVVVIRKSDSVEDLKIWLGDMKKRVILNSSRGAGYTCMLELGVQVGGRDLIYFMDVNGYHDVVGEGERCCE